MDGSQWVDPLAACVTYQLKKKKEAWMEVCIKSFWLMPFYWKQISMGIWSDKLFDLGTIDLESNLQEMLQKFIIWILRNEI